MFVRTVTSAGMGTTLVLSRMFFEAVSFVDVYEWGLYK